MSKLVNHGFVLLQSVYKWIDVIILLPSFSPLFSLCDADGKCCRILKHFTQRPYPEFNFQLVDSQNVRICVAFYSIYFNFGVSVLSFDVVILCYFMILLHVSLCIEFQIDLKS